MEKNHPSWGPVIPAPVIITSLLLSLYSILTIYCVLLCMSVMHDAPVIITSLLLSLYSILTIYCVLLCMSVMHDAPVIITSLLLSLYSILTIYCVLLCMSAMHDALGRVGDPVPCYLRSLEPDHWKLDIVTLKVHYGEKSSLIKDQSWGLWVSGWVLWGPLIPAPMVITSLLLSLYSVLTIYCVLLCMSVMHDAFGDSWGSHSCYLRGLAPDLSTNH